MGSLPQVTSGHGPSTGHIAEFPPGSVVSTERDEVGSLVRGKLTNGILTDGHGTTYVFVQVFVLTWPRSEAEQRKQLRDGRVGWLRHRESVWILLAVPQYRSDLWTHECVCVA